MTPSAIFIQVLRICTRDEVNLHNRRFMSQARRTRGILREARDECDARDEGKRKINHVHYMNVAFQLVN